MAYFLQSPLSWKWIAPTTMGLNHTGKTPRTGIVLQTNFFPKKGEKNYIYIYITLPNPSTPLYQYKPCLRTDTVRSVGLN